MDKHIGILAYGSLIGEPGDEIGPLVVERLPCMTPFNVEFGRISKSRGNAPTLIPIENGGSSVSAFVLVLENKVTLDDAKSMLWRRETRTADLSKAYRDPKKPGPNRVIVNSLVDFHGVRNVVYTRIGSNIVDNSPSILADYAIRSILQKAGKDKKDGIRYLLNAKNNGIVTRSSVDYEAAVLQKTGTGSLEEAIEKLDHQRIAQK